MNIHRMQRDSASPEQGFATPAEVMLQVWALAVRHKLLIGSFVAGCLVLAVGYLLITPKQYSATAEMIIDPRKSNEFQQQSSASMVAPVDSAVVESQGEILKSENVALAVIKDLDLVNNPTFSEPRGLTGILTSIVRTVFSGEPPTDYKRLRETVEQFQNRLTVKRVGVTYVFEISFLSPDPEQAAQIANAVAEAYVTDDLNAKYNARRRAAAWMQDRIKQLGEQATEAEHAVVDFKSKNNIVNTGGRFLDEQQVAELSSQLSIARAATSEAKAKLDRIEEVTRTGKLDLSVADAIRNEVIIKLRDSYLDLMKREADLSSRLGKDHQAPQRLRADMQNLRASMFDELKRIGESYRSDYQIALSREKGLNDDLSKAVQSSQTTSSAQVRARELESAAQSYRALYDSFLQRYTESIQQQSFPLTETRVVTSASQPLKKSQPKTLLTLLGAIVAGSFLGFGFGWLRDTSDRTLRSGAQAEAVTEALHIASVPAVPAPLGGESKDLFKEVVHRPLSIFAESIRELRVMVEIHRSEQNMRVIAFTSALQGEGKSTIAVNLGHLMARSKTRVLLIDGDLRNPTISRQALPGSTRGLVDVLLTEAGIDDAIFTDPGTGLDILPAHGGRDRSDSSELLTSSQMKTLLEQMKQHYDFVIVDLPPLLPVIDAKAAANLFDGFVFVAEWGTTPTESVTQALRSSARIRDRLIGVVLNKVDARLVGQQRGQGYHYAETYVGV